MSAQHTRGPWYVELSKTECGGPYARITASTDGFVGERYMRVSGCIDECDARLIAAAPDLLGALRESVDAMWFVDSHSVRFDPTVLFGSGYDFSGLDGPSREEFLAEHECVVWRSGGKWSAYCTFEGSTWFERFDSAADAKERCMKLLDNVLPDHPAMRARAAIAKATGVTA